jgi:hypothetical protein
MRPEPRLGGGSAVRTGPTLPVTPVGVPSPRPRGFSSSSRPSGPAVCGPTAPIPSCRSPALLVRSAVCRSRPFRAGLRSCPVCGPPAPRPSRSRPLLRPHHSGSADLRWINLRLTNLRSTVYDPWPSPLACPGGLGSLNLLPSMPQPMRRCHQSQWPHGQQPSGPVSAHPR